MGGRTAGAARRVAQHVQLDDQSDPGGPLGALEKKKLVLGAPSAGDPVVQVQKRILRQQRARKRAYDRATDAHPHVGIVGGVPSGDQGGAVETSAPGVYTVVRVVTSKRLQKRYILTDNQGVQAATAHGTAKQFTYKQLRRAPDDTVGEDTNNEAYRTHDTKRT